ncbi:WD40 repeat-like protein [Rhizophagus irregularis]|nr:WD40 repeat-like protein [Rhizophagus irregularis]
MTRKKFHHRSSHYQQSRLNNRRTNNITRPQSQSSSIDSSSSLSVAISDETPKEIPGYYYDHEKNRYFKIMPNKAVGSSNPFSADSITKRVEEKARELVIPNQIPNGISLLLDREINFNKPIYTFKSENRQILIKSLRQVGSIIPTAIERTPIKDFQIHPYFNKILYGDSFGNISQMKIKCTSSSCMEIYNDQMAKLTSEISSVRLDRTDLLMATTLGDTVASGNMYILKLPSGPYRDTALDVRYTYRSGSTIWTSSFSEIDSSIALGSSRKLCVIQGWEEYPCVNNFKTNSDVFALDFDRYQPDIVFAGCRDGKLRIYDIRSDCSNSHYGIGPPISQQSPICHIRQIGAWYILSDGMDGSLSLWDVRNERRNFDKTYVYEPVLEFKGNVNSTNIQYGFDVNLKEDIVAIAGQDNKVRFFSINTGRAIRYPIGPFKDKVSALRFCTWDSVGLNPELDERGEGIWMAAGKEFIWWSIGNNDM